jgi:hypothetical protein
MTINLEGTPSTTFSRASKNVAAVASLLDTLLAPSTDGASKVYQQLKDILGVVAEQQAESSLQRRAEASISRPSRSKACRQRTTIEHPVAGTASSPAWAPSGLRPSHQNRCLEYVERQ